MADKIRVLLVDDHEVVRVGLRTLLSHFDQIEIVGEAATGEECIAASLAQTPDIILLDIRLPGRSGIEICRDIRHQLPSTRVVMLTSYDSTEYIHDAMLAGASGFLLKEIGAESLIHMLEAVMRGERVFDKSTLSHVVQNFQQESEVETMLASLTPVERKILRLIATGMTNRDIADDTYLSEKTIRNYVSSVLSKLGLHNRTEAAALAVQHHLDERWK